MDNEYGYSMDNYDSDYTSEIYPEEESNEYAETYYEQQEQIIDQTEASIPQTNASVITQPVIAQPIYTQPIYTQPVILQSVIPAVQPAEPPEEVMYPAEPIYPMYPVQSYLPAEEIKAERWHASPVLVFFALLLCFPIGLVLLLFFTKWGVFPKIFITLFTLICIWFAYEIVAFYTSFGLPSLLNSIL